MSAAVRVIELERENAQLGADLASLTADNAALKQQVEWFKRQLFGVKSEKRLDVDPAIQGNLLSALGVAAPPPPKDEPKETITYQRRKKVRDGAISDTGLRFGDDVPREIIAVKDPEIEAIPEDRRELIGEKVTYRLAQRPGSYVVLEYTRPVYKLLDDQTIVTTPAPANVLEKSVVDVSFLAGMLIDKFCYHLPLYRQHQRLLQAGIQVSRSSLTTWASRAIDLLRPIVDAQCRNTLQSRVLAMDDDCMDAGGRATQEQMPKRRSRRVERRRAKCTRPTSGQCMAIPMKWFFTTHRRGLISMYRPSWGILPAPCSVTGTMLMRPMPGKRRV